MKQKKMLLSFLFVMVTCVFSVRVYAHEIFYEGSSPNFTPIPVKWSVMLGSGSTAYLKVNADYLSSAYSTHYVNATNAWPSATTKVAVARVSFSDSNVDILTPITQWWDNRFGYFDKYNVYGTTEITTTDNKIIRTTTDAKNSTKLLKYGHVYMSPYPDKLSSENHKLQTMIHELGHVLGLGHSNLIYYPSNDPSIMRSGGYPGYSTIQQHDKNDISSKY